MRVLGARRSYRFIGAVTAAALALSSAARADTPEGAPRSTVASLVTGRSDSPRIRFGLGLVSGWVAVDQGHGTSGEPALMGLDLRLGVQIDDWVAVFSQFSAAVFDLRASLMVEVTPFWHFSAGLGLGFDSVPATGSAGQTNALVVPVRLAVNFPIGGHASTQRHAVAVALYVLPGEAYSGGSDGHRRFEVGFLAGPSVELY